MRSRFWLLALLTLAGYVALSLWFPLRPYFNHSPSPDIRSLAPSLRDAFIYALLLCVLYGLYGLAYRHIRHGHNRLSTAAVLLAAAAYCVPLILTFPINAADAYRYFIRGRISSVHRQSPFEVPVADLANEPYAPLAGEWATETSPYGPLWELAAASITSLVPDNLWLGLLLFKGLAATSFLLVGALIWLSMPDVSQPRRKALLLLWAWNPSLLLIFAMNGHNDAFMLTWLALGWLLMARNQLQFGMITMLLAPLVKSTGLLPLPFFFIACWKMLPNRIARLRFLTVTILAGLALVLIAFLPFGSPIPLIQRLLSIAGSGGGFSPLPWIILEARARGLDPSIQLAIQLGSLLLILLALWLLWQTWRGRSPLKAAADIFAGFIIQAFHFRIWYAVWPFPWLLLDRGQIEEDDPPSKARLAAGLTFLFTSQLSVLVYGQIRTELLGSSQLRAHRAGIFLTFLIPLLTGLAVAAYSARSRDRRTGK
jgi:alpha-1,6-mannosyltransferase